MQIDGRQLPKGCELFQTQRSLQRRLGPGFTEMAVSRLIASGRLKPTGKVGTGSVFRTADIEAVLAEARGELVAKALMMSSDERAKFIQELAAENARIAWRKSPDAADLKLAERHFLKAEFDARLLRTGSDIASLSAALERMKVLLSSLGSRLSLDSPLEERRRYQLRAERVDTAGGVLRRVTVAESGVQATGKFVFLDAAGAVTRDEQLAKKKLPIFTDGRTLESLMTAAKAAGSRLKVREDHSDEVGARAGFADSFEMDGGRVVADVHLFGGYRNRNIVLETAEKAPEQVGLSIDFAPEFEIAGDRALMRIVELYAVDIVDAGAVTPNGLL